MWEKKRSLFSVFLVRLRVTVLSGYGMKRRPCVHWSVLYKTLGLEGFSWSSPAPLSNHPGQIDL